MTWSQLIRATACLITFLTLPTFAASRSHSTFRFVDAESGAPLRPQTVQIDGQEVAKFTAEDGSLVVECDTGEHYVIVQAEGYRPMRAWHAAGPHSKTNVFHLVVDTPVKPLLLDVETSACNLSGWVRSADDHGGIARARVAFESDSARLEVETDDAGAYCLSVPPAALEGQWQLTAESAGFTSRAWRGEGKGDAALGMKQVFVLFSRDGATRRPADQRRIAVLPTRNARTRVATLATQTPPNTIRVGLGAPLQTTDGCSGSNARCSSGFNACTGGVDIVEREVYVKRVLRGELNVATIWNDPQLENFKAMAVAIRTYSSWHALNDHRGSQYDICNSDYCQCYFSGFSNFGPVSTTASDQTAGEVLVNAAGQIARTEYGSWNGPCPRGITHCEQESAYPNVQPIYDYAIDQNWALRPADPRLWGHGHGLSQYGSHFRAKNSETYRGILDFYYRDYGWQLASTLVSSPPMAPTGLTATANSSSSIAFSWVDNSNNESGFTVFRWNGSTWTNIATVGADVTSLTDNGLQPSTTYYHTVCAYNGTGSNCASTYSTATTHSANPITPPAAPSALWAAPQSSWSIAFGWADNSNNETSFAVYRWNGSAWVNIATLGANASSYTDTGLQPYTTYYHTVCAQNAAGGNCASTYTTATTY